MGLGSKLLYDTAKPLSLSLSQPPSGGNNEYMIFFCHFIYVCFFFTHTNVELHERCAVYVWKIEYTYFEETLNIGKRERKEMTLRFCANVAFEMFLCDMITGFFYFYFPLHTSAVLPLDENKFWEIVTFCVHQIKDLYTHLL